MRYKAEDASWTKRMATKTRKRFLFVLVFSFGAAAGRAQTLQADVSFLHALHQWNTTGFSADLGGLLAGQHFLGLEFTAFNPKFTYSYPIYGSAHVDERIETLQLAYRFSFPLSTFGSNHRHTPFEFYVGGAGGLGRVRQTLTNTSTGVAALAPQQETELCVELAAGLQCNFGPYFGIKAGFRYIDSINNVRLFNTDANTDTKALEAGVVFRF